MQAKLSQILKAKLVSDGTVTTKQFHEAILANAKSVQHAEATSTNFALCCKFVVHALECSFEEDIVLRPGNQVTDQTEAQHDRSFVNLAVRDAYFDGVKR